MGLALAFIAHDLLVVRHLSHRVMVMYLGQVMEMAPSRTLFASPSHPYTRALLAAVPKPDPSRAVQPPPVLGGELPSPLDPPSGCRFRTRCPHAVQRCADEVPGLRPMPNGAASACHFAEAVLAGDLAPFISN
jgi:oligopeptide/dipeptide ABC transporter ATP-binding protein